MAGPASGSSSSRGPHSPASLASTAPGIARGRLAVGGAGVRAGSPTVWWLGGCLLPSPQKNCMPLKKLVRADRVLQVMENLLANLVYKPDDKTVVKQLAFYAESLQDLGAQMGGNFRDVIVTVSNHVKGLNTIDSEHSESQHSAEAIRQCGRSVMIRQKIAHMRLDEYVLDGSLMKDGAGGKGIWGKLIDTDVDAFLDRNDPNYDSGEVIRVCLVGWPNPQPGPMRAACQSLVGWRGFWARLNGCSLRLGARPDRNADIGLRSSARLSRCRLGREAAPAAAARSHPSGLELPCTDICASLLAHLPAPLRVRQRVRPSVLGDAVGEFGHLRRRRPLPLTSQLSLARGDEFGAPSPAMRSSFHPRRRGTYAATSTLSDDLAPSSLVFASSRGRYLVLPPDGCFLPLHRRNRRLEHFLLPDLGSKLLEGKLFLDCRCYQQELTIHGS